LADSEVHVWCVALAQTTVTIKLLWDTLSPEECERAGRFYFARDRERFIVARGMLRAILGRYLNMDPTQLRFCYNQYGKPALASDQASKMLSFNLSHSHELAVYAIAPSRMVGVDIEYIRPNQDERAIAEQFFSPREIAML